MKISDLVLVEWEDSMRPLPNWYHMDTLPIPLIVECESVGWIVHKDKKVLMLAPNMGDIDSEVNAQCSGIISIPIRCIVKINSLVIA